MFDITSVTAIGAMCISAALLLLVSRGGRWASGYFVAVGLAVVAGLVASSAIDLLPAGATFWDGVWAVCTSAGLFVALGWGAAFAAGQPWARILPWAIGSVLLLVVPMTFQTASAQAGAAEVPVPGLPPWAVALGPWGAVLAVVWSLLRFLQNIGPPRVIVEHHHFFIPKQIPHVEITAPTPPVDDGLAEPSAARAPVNGQGRRAR